jgi:hypothetical protein
MSKCVTTGRGTTNYEPPPNTHSRTPPADQHPPAAPTRQSAKHPPELCGLHCLWGWPASLESRRQPRRPGGCRWWVLGWWVLPPCAPQQSTCLPALLVRLALLGVAWGGGVEKGGTLGLSSEARGQDCPHPCTGRVRDDASKAAIRRVTPRCHNHTRPSQRHNTAQHSSAHSTTATTAITAHLSTQ